LQYDVQIELPIEKAKAPKATIDPVFDVVDRDAIKALQRSQVFWVGDFYNKNLASKMRKMIAELMILHGQNRDVAGRELERMLTGRFSTIELPSGWKGSARAYWESTAANIATTARAQGQVRSFSKLGVEYYEIVNPIDERTCEVCSHMDGKVFRTDAGMGLANAIVGAKSPAAVKDTKPWLGTSALRAISPKAGLGSFKDSKALHGSGQSLPPFHFRCRCTVDVTEEPPGWASDVEDL
jgi:SPP1 gp7 family putative phage head morphogenesis protein